MAELRGIAKGLRPSILDDLGLVASVSQLLADAGRRNSFETSIGVIGAERRLRPRSSWRCSGSAQEAFRTSSATPAPHAWTVGLSFDGQGIPPAGPGRRSRLPASVASDGDGQGESLGLPGMAERARLIGGDLRPFIRRRAGTTVDVWVPDASTSAGSDAQLCTWHPVQNRRMSAIAQLSHDRNDSAVWETSGGGTISCMEPVVIESCHSTWVVDLEQFAVQADPEGIRHLRPGDHRVAGAATGWRSTRCRSRSSSC